MDIETLKTRLRSLKHGDHACLIYDNDQEQLEVTAAFLMIGLERNERCFFMADPITLEKTQEFLATHNVDVAAEAGRGALKLVSERDYLEDGKFFPQTMLRFLQKAVDECLAMGFQGCRATGDMIWELGTDLDFHKLYQYEVMLDFFFERKKLVGICQYRQDIIPDQFIRHTMYTHPIVIYEGNVCHNQRFYDPSTPYAVQSPEWEAETVHSMRQEILKHCE